MYDVIQRNREAWSRPRSKFHFFFENTRFEVWSGWLIFTISNQNSSFQSWFMRVDEFLIDHSEVWASKVVSWEWKKFGTRSEEVLFSHPSSSTSEFFSLSTYHFWCSNRWMIDKKLIDTHKSALKTWILTWNGEDKSIWPHLDARVFKKKVKLRPWTWSSIVVSLNNNVHAMCWM